MAGQRRSNANVGLMARQAAQQGAATQQQAVGQGATMAAQQQLSGIQALQAQQGAMANVAGQQVGQQSSALSGLNNATQGAQGNILGAIGQQNNTNVGMQSNMNNANAGIQNTNAQGGQALLGGVMGGVASGLTMMNKGGEVQKFDDGGPVQTGQPQSALGRYIQKQGSNPFGAGMGNVGNPGANQLQSGMTQLGGGIGSMFGGPPAPATMGAVVDAAAHSGGAGAAVMNKGGKIHGEKFAMQKKEVPGKAKVKGDSLKNDTVNAKLSPGEIILPRTVAQHPNAPQMAAQFVAAVKARKR